MKVAHLAIVVMSTLKHLGFIGVVDGGLKDDDHDNEALFRAQVGHKYYKFT